MRRLCLLLGLIAGGAQAQEVRCPVGGTTIHWIADYCMMQMETDDEIAVGECIASHRKSAPRTDCAAKLHFKRRMCALHVSRDAARGTTDACVRDPAFMGRTVRNGGVRG